MAARRSGQAQAPGSIPAKTYAFLVLSGLATGASWLCYFRALKLGQAAQVAPIDKLSVVLAAIFGALFLGERLSGTNWLGVGLIAAGAVLESAGEGFRLVSAADPFPAWLGGLLGVVGTGGEEAIPVLAALMGVYDAGGVARRVRGDQGLVIEIVPAPDGDASAPGSEVGRWLFDDDLLISSALGLL